MLVDVGEGYVLGFVFVALEVGIVAVGGGAGWCAGVGSAWGVVLEGDAVGVRD